MLSEPRKKDAGLRKKKNCILHVPLKLTVLENVFGKTKSEIEVSAL